LTGSRREFQGVTLVIGLFLLSSCAPLRSYIAPETNLPDSYSVGSSAGQPVEDWWRALNDPTLNLITEQALAQSLELAIARNEVDQASAALSGTSGWLSGGLSANAAHSFDGNTATRGQLSLALPFGRDVRIARTTALARWQGAVMGEADARRRVALDVTKAFIELRYLQRLQVFLRQDLTSRKEIESWAELRVSRGITTEIDLTQAKAARVKIEADIAKADAEVMAKLHQIATIVGVPLEDVGVRLMDPGRQPLPEGMPSIGYPADFLRNRPDVRRADRAYAAAISQLNAATAARYPRLSLGGTIDLESGQASENVFAGILLPVFDQPRLKAAERQAEAATEGALLAWKQSVLAALAEVEIAAQKFAGSRRTAERAHVALKLNEEAAAFYLNSMQQGGPVTALDILNQQQALTDARLAAANSLRDVALNYVELRTAIGMPLDVDATVDPEN